MELGSVEVRMSDSTVFEPVIGQLSHANSAYWLTLLSRSFLHKGMERKDFLPPETYWERRMKFNLMENFSEN